MGNETQPSAHLSFTRGFLHFLHLGRHHDEARSRPRGPCSPVSGSCRRRRLCRRGDARDLPSLRNGGRLHKRNTEAPSVSSRICRNWTTALHQSRGHRGEGGRRGRGLGYGGTREKMEDVQEVCQRRERKERRKGKEGIELIK